MESVRRACLCVGLVLLFNGRVENQETNSSTTMITVPSDIVSNNSSYHDQVEFITDFLLNNSQNNSSNQSAFMISSTDRNKESEERLHKENSLENNNLEHKKTKSTEDGNMTPNELQVIPMKSVPAAISSVIDTLPVHPRIPRGSLVKRRTRVRLNRHSTRVNPGPPVRFLLPPPMTKHKCSDHSVAPEPPFQIKPIVISSSTPLIPFSAVATPNEFVVAAKPLQVKSEQEKFAQNDKIQPPRRVFIPPPPRHLLPPPFSQDNHLSYQHTTTQSSLPERNSVTPFSPQSSLLMSSTTPHNCDKSNRIETSSIKPIVVFEDNREISHWNFPSTSLPPVHSFPTHNSEPVRYVELTNHNEPVRNVEPVNHFPKPDHNNQLLPSTTSEQPTAYREPVKCEEHSNHNEPVRNVEPVNNFPTPDHHNQFLPSTTSEHPPVYREPVRFVEHSNHNEPVRNVEPVNKFPTPDHHNQFLPSTTSEHPPVYREPVRYVEHSNHNAPVRNVEPINNFPMPDHHNQFLPSTTSENPPVYHEPVRFVEHSNHNEPVRNVELINSFPTPDYHNQQFSSTTSELPPPFYNEQIVPHQHTNRYEALSCDKNHSWLTNGPHHDKFLPNIPQQFNSNNKNVQAFFPNNQGFSVNNEKPYNTNIPQQYSPNNQHHFQNNQLQFNPTSQSPLDHQQSFDQNNQPFPANNQPLHQPNNPTEFLPTNTQQSLSNHERPQNNHGFIDSNQQQFPSDKQYNQQFNTHSQYGQQQFDLNNQYDQNFNPNVQHNVSPSELSFSQPVATQTSVRREASPFKTSPFDQYSLQPTTPLPPSSSVEPYPILRGPNIEQALFDTGNFQVIDTSFNDSGDSTVEMMNRPLLTHEVAKAGMKITANLKMERINKAKLSRGKYKYNHLDQFNFPDSSRPNEVPKSSKLLLSETSYYNDRRGVQELNGITDLSVIPGRAGVDYPTLSRPPPRSDFSCRSVKNHRGYVADPSTRCQVFYICVGSGPGEAMLCPNGTLFSQDFLVCDWWFNIDCQPYS